MHHLSLTIDFSIKTICSLCWKINLNLLLAVCEMIRDWASSIFTASSGRSSRWISSRDNFHDASLKWLTSWDSIGRRKNCQLDPYCKMVFFLQNHRSSPLKVFFLVYDRPISTRKWDNALYDFAPIISRIKDHDDSQIHRSWSSAENTSVELWIVARQQNTFFFILESILWLPISLISQHPTSNEM